METLFIYQPSYFDEFLPPSLAVSKNTLSVTKHLQNTRVVLVTSLRRPSFVMLTPKWKDLSSKLSKLSDIRLEGLKSTNRHVPLIKKLPGLQLNHNVINFRKFAGFFLSFFFLSLCSLFFGFFTFGVLFFALFFYCFFYLFYFILFYFIAFRAWVRKFYRTASSSYRKMIQNKETLF